MDLKDKTEFINYMQKEIAVPGRSLLSALSRIADTVSNQVQAGVIVNFADRVRLTEQQLNDVNNMVKLWSFQKSKDRAIEELLELSLSLLHKARGKESIEDFHKEMADVRLALEHLEFKFGNYQKELDEKLAHNSKISE